MCVNGELIGSHGRTIEWAHPRPHVTPNTQTGEGGEKCPFEITAIRLVLDLIRQSMGGTGNTWAGYEFVYPLPFVPQPEGSQIGDHRLRTSCGVVERPDHHYGDDCVRRNAWNAFVPQAWPYVFVHHVFSSACILLNIPSKASSKTVSPKNDNHASLLSSRVSCIAVMTNDVTCPTNLLPPPFVGSNRELECVTFSDCTRRHGLFKFIGWQQMLSVRLILRCNTQYQQSFGQSVMLSCQMKGSTWQLFYINHNINNWANIYTELAALGTHIHYYDTNIEIDITLIITCWHAKRCTTQPEKCN